MEREDFSRGQKHTSEERASAPCNGRGPGRHRARADRDVSGKTRSARQKTPQSGSLSVQIRTLRDELSLTSESVDEAYGRFVGDGVQFHGWHIAVCLFESIKRRSFIKKTSIFGPELPVF